ncbi:MAG: class I SAM-dependent methyltransferase [Holosporales bacterium]|jgi:SAM-dependent methyltransferase
MEQWLYQKMYHLEDDHWWFAARREIIKTFLKGLSLPASPRLVEIGSGTGGNLAMLAKFGQVDAIEPNAEGRQYITKRGFSVQNGMLPDNVPLLPESIDVIAMLDVLEHVTEDAASLKTVYNLLKKNGYAVLTVPAFSFLWSYHDTQRHHHRRYTKKHLESLCLEAGFHIKKISYYNTILFPLIATIRLYNSIFKKNHGSDDKMPPLWINKILKTVFASERYWLKRGNFPAGVSLVVVLQKK